MTVLGFSVEDTRVQLGNIGRTKVYDLIKRGRLQKRKIGSRSIITADSVRDVAENGA